MVKTASLESAQASLKHPGAGARPLPKAKSKTKPTLYLFRHGETYDNRNRVFSGRRNSKLTPLGIRQAKVLAEKLKNKKVDLAVFSDIAAGKSDRAERTLTEVLKYHPRVEAEANLDLYERDYGQLTGKSKLKLNRENPELCLKYRRSWNFPPPGGESLKMVWENRVKKFCQNLEKRMKKEKINVAVSCTNNTMRLIRMYFEKLTVKQMLELENPLGQDYAAYVIRQSGKTKVME